MDVYVARLDRDKVTKTWWVTSHDWNVAMKGHILLRKDRPRKVPWWNFPLCEETHGTYQALSGVDDERIERL